MGFRWKIFIFLVLLLHYLHFTNGQQGTNNERRPKVFGDKIPNKALYPWTSRVMKKIVLYHNFFRSKVQPPASNMLVMKWHKGAARSAQTWSNRCNYLKHNPREERYIPEFGSCGQNIFVSSHQVPWFFAVKTWFLENQNFTYNSPTNQIHQVGHYTQMVWATTHKVGCGFTKCPREGPEHKPFFNYVCNYCPTGNWDGKLGKPYKSGKPCGLCPRKCKVGKLCKNGCPYADQWSNCKHLMKYGKEWLCQTDTSDGRQRKHYCKATCKCKGLIHEWR